MLQNFTGNPGKGLKECLNPKNFPGSMTLDPFLEEWAFSALFGYWSSFILDPHLQHVVQTNNNTKTPANDQLRHAVQECNATC